MPIRLVVFDWAGTLVDFGGRESPVLTPGAAEAGRFLRSRGLHVATTTDCPRAALDAWLTAAREQGFEPDAAASPDDVPRGRPAPWMIFRLMEELDVYPPKAVLKVGGTPLDMAEARAAGTWALGVVDSSGLMGLSEAEFAALAPADREGRRSRVRDVLLDAGADGVIDSLVELPEAIEALESLG